MDALIQSVMDAGLVQFGAFGAAAVPVQTRLELLPSYPMVLRSLADALAAHVTNVEHLLCTADALPLGVALSLQTGVPVVYVQGTGADPVTDLVGAYDIGHPALLVTNVWNSDVPVGMLVNGARRVGLEVRGVLCLIDFGIVLDSDLPVTGLFGLEGLVQALVEAGRLPAGQGAMVRTWIERQRQTRVD